MTIDTNRVEYYINFLTGIATGGDYKVANTEYKQIRAELLKTTDLAIKEGTQNLRSAIALVNFLWDNYKMGM
jgi:hypothetical protein